MTWVPVNEPLLTDEDFAPLEDAFRSGWISSAGRYVDEFEERWAGYCCQRHGIAVANGTVALQVAVEALEIGASDGQGCFGTTMVSLIIQGRPAQLEPLPPTTTRPLTPRPQRTGPSTSNGAPSMILPEKGSSIEAPATAKIFFGVR